MHRRVATDEFSRGFQPTERDTPTPRRVATDEYPPNDTISRPHRNAGAIVRIHHESGHPRWGSAVADATGTIGGRRDPWVETHGIVGSPTMGFNPRITVAPYPHAGRMPALPGGPSLRDNSRRRYAPGGGMGYASHGTGIMR
ncbi:hypothetical protein J8C01_09880 [Chloracidobacterium sp. D]|uniref:hypothetical protein n=1 Tax=Chloracidobacterium sp. D TaxID=2821536 RepID=UPI001B8A9126|nr:hypothetical protein [Chloracidobacterium sp. D]QUV81519.1 hypothetical protein J8C01_09880 [Chloracidobacterium sp. D]